MSDLERKVNKFLFNISGGERRKLWTALAKLVSNGVPILDALKLILDVRVQVSGGKDATSTALREWSDRIRNGHRLSAAIEGWALPEEQMLIAAGEQSGKLDEALINAATVMQAKSKIKNAVIRGLLYPIILVGAGTGVLLLFSYKVIPAFSQVVSDEKWTGIARVLVDIAGFTRSWIILILALVVALVVGVFVSFPRWSGGARVTLDRYAPYSIYRMIQGGSWMIGLAALVSAGVRIETALQQLAGDSKWLQDRSNAILLGMRSGLSIGEAMAKTGYGFPDREIIGYLGVYAKLSGFEQALTLIGKEWIDEGVEKIQGMMGVIFGASVLTIGLAIAFLVGGLISMELQMAAIMQGNYH